MTFTLVDNIGYLASIFLIISFFLRDIRKLRMLNSVGCALFVVYGFIGPDLLWPVIITNVFILGANFYYLFGIKRT